VELEVDEVDDNKEIKLLFKLWLDAKFKHLADMAVWVQGLEGSKAQIQIAQQGRREIAPSTNTSLIF